MTAPAPGSCDARYDTWLLIHRRRFRRWHWELRNLVGYVWAEGTARSFDEAEEAGRVRSMIGPHRPMPTTPDPGAWQEAPPRFKIIPLRRRAT